MYAGAAQADALLGFSPVRVAFLSLQRRCTLRDFELRLQSLLQAGDDLMVSANAAHVVAS